MPLFNARVNYALRAVVDLAQQPPDVACQSREIAARQSIRGPYLDQILSVLKREGLIRSIRGAGGGYTLARPASRITVGDVVRAVTGSHLLVVERPEPFESSDRGAAFVVQQFAARLEERLAAELDRVTIADLVTQRLRLDDALSIMPGI